MKKILSAAALTLLASTATLAQQPAPGAMSPSSAATLMTAVPDGATITNYYKQNVYDPSDNKIGEIADVLVTREGRVTALIISVGATQQGDRCP